MRRHAGWIAAGVLTLALALVLVLWAPWTPQQRWDTDLTLGQSHQQQGLDITVTSIEWVDECGDGTLPLYGQFLLAHVQAELDADAEDFAVLAEGTFTVTDADGLSAGEVSRATWGCRTEASLPNFIDPGQSVSGTLILEASARTGWLVYTGHGPTIGWQF